MRHTQRGFVLATTLMLLSLFLALLGAYWSVTQMEAGTVKYSRGSSSGFYAAEAALNLRAESIRAIFVGFNRPAGTSPNATNPCTTGNNGSGDYACQTHSFNNRDVKSYVTEAASNPVILTIPPGERYQNLNAQEYRYTSKSEALNVLGSSEANLELQFKSRLVPLFQFAAFYAKDLEILPGPTMSLAGPVHTNGDLYLYSNGNSLTINGQVTTAGDLWRGRKDGSISPSCSNSPVNIYNPNTPQALIPACPSRTKVQTSQVSPWNGMIQMRVHPVTVPGPEVFDPTPGHVYWDKADLRVVLNLNASNAVVGIEVRNAADSNQAAQSAMLNGCAGQAPGGRAVGTTTIFNWRENKTIRLLDVDMLGTLDCLRASNWLGTGKALNDSTEGGLVFHFTVKGPNSAAAANPYGVRLRRGARLQVTAGNPVVRGVTVVSDQAVYVMGNYNSTNKIPAAVMADSINVLSNNWNDANSGAGIGSRVATSTTINSAFLAGTDTTGNTEGAGGQNGAYSGGLENYPRFHENWGGRVFTYRGSFVSLGRPLHVTGAWGAQSYSPPSRDWNYDTSFNNAANLPPITPRFVYLRQELFVRDFEK